MRRLITALLMVPIVGWLGCSLLIGLDEGHAGDLCQWLEHHDANCVSQFAESPKALACGSGRGAFPTGDTLSTCTVLGGGSIVFDPPIVPAQWSPDVQRQITFLADDGTECGSFTYKKPFSFSVSLHRGDGTKTTLTIDHDVVSKDLNVSCPGASTSSEVHHFNLDQLSSSDCTNVAEEVPQAIFELTRSSTYHPGLLRLEVHYPSTKISPPAPPGVLTYVECSFPASVCAADGIKNGGEADVDCGGAETMPGCPPRCGAGQLCATDCDCDVSSRCKNIGGVLECVPDANPQSDPCAGIICGNTTKDDTESALNCGGVCPFCPDGKTCGKNADCLSYKCRSGLCEAATCTDLARNGDESDIDCGGSVCPKCGDGQKCAINADCMPSGCFEGVCSACANAVKDGAETAVDCGGPTCAKCGEGLACAEASDCATEVCAGGKCNGCSDGSKDGMETDKDCGGPICSKDPATQCKDGQVCIAATDCFDEGCLNGQCSACANGLQDNDESDVDCGYSGAPADPTKVACPKCDNGKVCVDAADCISGQCDGNNCGSCADGMKDGSESDVDCGGFVCSKCPEGKVCNVNFDCALGICELPSMGTSSSSSTGGGVVTGICNTCNDNFTDGTESDQDCGGATCKKCVLGDICKVNSDCTSNICINKLCK